MKSKLLASVMLASVLCGCGTVTDFGLPEALHAYPASASMAEVSAALQARADIYISSADELADSTQRFDLPLLGLATIGLGAAIFGSTDDTARIAGLTGTGILGARQYYNPGGRFGPYLGAADGLSCLATLSQRYSFLTSRAARQWRGLLNDSYLAENLDAPLRDDVRRLAPIAIAAPDAFAAAARSVDRHVLRRTGTPTAPSLNGLMEAYRQNFEAAQSGETQNETTESEAAEALVAFQRLTAANAGQALAPVTPDFNTRAAIALANQAHNDLLVNLAASLDQCVALAAG